MNMKEIKKYGPDFIYFEEPDAPIDNGFFEHLQNITETMTRVRKVIDIRSNHISKEPQEIVNQMFDNNSERINKWLNQDFATDNLVEKANLGMVSAVDWDVVYHRVSYFIRQESKHNDIIANLSEKEKATLCDILSIDVYGYHEEYRSKNAHKGIDYKDDEYCAFGTPADKRNCETCSMTHYFLDCNGNPIHSKDDE